MVTLSFDPRVDFPAAFVQAKTKTEKRKFVADHALLWIRDMKRRGATGCLMFDIDDTIINGNEAVTHGFEQIKELYNEASQYYPVYIVTARPDSEHDNVMALLRKLGFAIPPDRLHMLPEALYDGPSDHVVDFKWQCFLDMAQKHGGCVARFGDRKWDVAHRDSLDTYLDHVRHADCYIMRDPALRGTVSYKLPG